MRASAPPSLTKTRLWRVGLVGLALCGIYAHIQSRGSLATREEAAWRKTAERHEELQRTQETLAEIAALELEAEEARAGLDRWDQGRGAGSLRVWFPEWLRSQLRHSGIGEAQIRVTSERAEPGLVGLKRISCHVHVPAQKGAPNVAAVILALRDLDQRERFVRVVDCSFRAGAEAPHWPMGDFNIEAVVRE